MKSVIVWVVERGSAEVVCREMERGKGKTESNFKKERIRQWEIV